MTESEELRERVRTHLRRHGFDRVGFARAEPLGPEAPLSAWIARGYHGEMEWIARSEAKRLDPSLVLPGTRTVAVVALHYAAPPRRAADLPGDRGVISAYARGTDYHRVIEARLRRATRTLRDSFGILGRWYVDTGPVLEREWARRSGVGWIGKNACAIDASAGSWFFLGTILLQAALPPDPPAVERCGSCRRCIDACPTGAIVEPGVVDARRCVSYLTIEHRGAIPTDLAAGCGSLVFGCDICQEACPYNRAPTPEGDAELAPRPENQAPRLADLLELDETRLGARFPRSAVRRARWNGLLRNVLVAIGNSGRPELAAALDELAELDVLERAPGLRQAWNQARNRLQRGELEE